MAHVAITVPRELRSPIVAVAPRHGAVLWAAVPEAAIDEDGEFRSREGDIDPKHSLRGSNRIIDPETQTSGVKELPRGDLRLGVTATVRHHAPPGGWSNVPEGCSLWQGLLSLVVGLRLCDRCLPVEAGCVPTAENVLHGGREMLEG